ncbi:MAG: hypothetical protein ACFCUG_12865 [Thiotrichales bacterium]
MIRRRQHAWLGAIVWLVLSIGVTVRADEVFSFDPTEFEKKPFEFGGYLELKPERLWLNQDGAFYTLNFFDRRDRVTLDRGTGTLKLDGKYTRGITSFNLRANLDRREDALNRTQSVRFDAAYGSLKPAPRLTVDAGKIALKWGKGYAWNPVGFVERPKDPNDVELAREGFTLLTADLIRHFDGELKTVAFTPLVLPVSDDINTDFGRPDHTNFAAKLYLLYRDTDIDLTWLAGGSRTPRFGVDFSRNLTPALEIHGEWARIRDFETRLIDAEGTVTSRRDDVTSALLGLRYLTARDTTYILEYYRNGGGYTEADARAFYALVDNGVRQFETTGTGSLLEKATLAGQRGYGRPNAMRNYLYLRVSQKEPFDIVYFTPAVATIVNLDDGSFSLTPELLYTGITNLNLRLRATWLNGGVDTEFGEKQNDARLELVARYYF